MRQKPRAAATAPTPPCVISPALPSLWRVSFFRPSGTKLFCRDNLRWDDVAYEFPPDFRKPGFPDEALHQDRAAAPEKIGHARFRKHLVEVLIPCTAPILFAHVDENKASSMFEHAPEFGQDNRQVFQRDKVKHVTIIKNIKNAVRERQCPGISLPKIYIGMACGIGGTSGLLEHFGRGINAVT